ncbi:hypothetical protein M3A82_004645 [Micrococcus luteus]|uniref:Uncharacterized protein n=1 Tax=Micrococcus luteus TaxID=1270 RepID=A0AAP3ERT3_MICLU|nr:hypothetical protein [Micrococcus luteus]
MTTARTRRDAIWTLIAPHLPTAVGPGPVRYDLDALADTVLVEYDGQWSLRPSIDPHSFAFQQLCTEHSSPKPAEDHPPSEGRGPSLRRRHPTAWAEYERCDGTAPALEVRRARPDRTPERLPQPSVTQD